MIKGKVKYETGFFSHSDYNCIESYKETDDNWDNCPNCGLKPKAWQFDNGRSTACGCWKSKYDQHHVFAESVMSVHKRTNGKKMNQYDIDGLRKNWNHWCRTGEHTFNVGSGLW